jgi:hypothetical protein
LSGLVPFEQAETILQEIGQVNVSRCSIWHRSQVRGAQFKALEKEERAKANALPEQWQPPSRAIEGDWRMGAAMDGMMVHVRKEGWKELKVCKVFDIEVRLGKDEHTHEPVQMAYAIHNTYTAHLGGREVFGEMVLTEARRWGWEQAQDTQAVADGAAWIWNQADMHFGQATNSWTDIACELEQAANDWPTVADDLCREAGYFRKHQHRMNYLEMREEAYVIGSEMVEGSAKQYQARLCGPGMRWSRTHLEWLIPIRTAILSGRFADLWKKVYNSPLS